MTKNILLLCIALFSLNTMLKAQEDDSKNVQNYDLIYMKNGQVLRGEIIIFQESDGDITFKDTEGKMYSITREEYKYFKQNVRFAITKNDTLIIRERKEKQVEFTVGLRNNNMIESSRNLYTTIPVSGYLGFGKYFNRRVYLGIGANFGLVETKAFNKYLSPGIDIKYQYDGYKNNFALYVIGNANYTMHQGLYAAMYQVNIWGKSELGDVSHKYSSAGISIGHGVCYILNGKKTVGFELIFTKLFPIEADFTGDAKQNESQYTLYDRTFSNISLGIVFNL